MEEVTLLKVDDNNIFSKLAGWHFRISLIKSADKSYCLTCRFRSEKNNLLSIPINSVNKLRQIPLRLTTEFKMDSDGKAVEREDYEQLNSSECVHELMAVEIARLSRHNNTMSIFKAMQSINDDLTLKLFDSKTNRLNPLFIKDMQAPGRILVLRQNDFLGPVYSKNNWEKLQKALAPALNQRIRDKTDYGGSPFIWVAPSDPYWSKSIRFISSLSNFLASRLRRISSCINRCCTSLSGCS